MILLTLFLVRKGIIVILYNSEEIMKHLNMQTNHSRVNSGIAQLSPNKCTTFRTILKPRNDTILMEQLNVNPSLQRSKVKITEHTTSQSQIFTNEE